MATTRDGLKLPYPPDVPWLVIGGLLLVGGLVAAVIGLIPGPAGVASGAGGSLLGVLVLINQKGSKRIRATHSKLLVENERLIRGFLIGPRKERVAWSDITGVSVDGDSLKVDTASGSQRFAEGASAEDLSHLKQKVDAALARHQRK